jgi:hypothetical protein
VKSISTASHAVDGSLCLAFPLHLRQKWRNSATPKERNHMVASINPATPVNATDWKKAICQIINAGSFAGYTATYTHHITVSMGIFFFFCNQAPPKMSAPAGSSIQAIDPRILSD